MEHLYYGSYCSSSVTSVLLGTLSVLTMVLAALTGSLHCFAPVALVKRFKLAIKSAAAGMDQSSSSDGNCKGAPPGPRPWPVIGSLHLLAKYEVPFEAFSQLSKMYGDIFSITLGSTPCVVVNSFPLIKEVLIAKGPHFGGRPNFIRYDILFGGDRDNCKFIFFLFLFLVNQLVDSFCSRVKKK